MSTRIRIGLIGDRSDSIVAHRAIPPALSLAATELSIEVEHEWVGSEQVTAISRIAAFDGLWAIPGSPYRSMEGVLLAIRYAREQQRPFLGTCGGFQHAVLEYARNVLQWSDADHAESSPDAERAVIAPLTCGLLNDFGSLRLVAGTRLARAYGALHTKEEYLCSYGVNPAFRAALASGPLREAAVDAEGDLRAVELDGHRFFVGTLFQPERAALRGTTPPPVIAFLRACLE
jgi:CTP synthase (UTP-ammonia lyase)